MTIRIDDTLEHLGIEDLTDPGFDRVLFWDESANALKWLTVSTGLQIVGTNLSSTITQYTDAMAIAAIKGDAAWNATDWDTAYGWGDHSTEGYLKTLAFAGLSDYPVDAVGVLTNNGTGTLSWGAGGGSPEGTDILSTGESGGIKFLREDGDGTSSWQTIAGGGDVSKVGTPVDNQVGVWTGDGTIEGTAGLTYDGSNLLLTGDIGITGTRITKGWFTDLEVTNAIAGSVTGNAATVTNATLTTALTVNTGTLTLTADAGNDSVLTIGGGAVSVSGSNTGDQDLSGYLTKATYDAHTVLYATTDDTPAALSVTEQTLVGRLTGGNISAVTIGIADNNILQVDHNAPADNDFAKFTAAGIEGRSYTEVKQDLDLEIGTDVAAVNQTMYIGTTQVAINRSSAALTLAGLTLTTPDIGTPGAGTLTNCTGLPAASVVAGTLGSGNYVFDGTISAPTEITFAADGKLEFNPAPSATDKATGIILSMTVDENTVGIGGVLHLDTDGHWVDADMNSIADMPCMAIALGTTGTVDVMLNGIIKDTGWSWTVGGIMYVNTAGTMTQTAPSGASDQVQVVGIALASDTVYFNPSLVLVEIVE